MMMIRVPILLITASMASGFVVIPQNTRTTLLCQERISWAEYKHDYVDPLIPHHVEKEETVEKQYLDPEKRRKADEFWVQQFEHDKERLHDLNEADHRSVGASPRPTESYKHYQSANIDPITPHETKLNLQNHMDPAKRKEADEYWLKVYEEEKARLHQHDNDDVKSA